MKDIVLASGSPRRSEILKKLGVDFKIIVPSVDETQLKNESAEQLVLRLAELKAKSVFDQVSNSHVIGADTVVVQDEVLGKPKNALDAKSMLAKLSGNIHYVITGVAVIDSKTSKVHSFYIKTSVKFAKLDESEIDEYIKSGEPFDKAGAYAIQGSGGKFVEGIDGCFYNVMGLPLNQLYKLLKELNILI